MRPINTTNLLLCVAFLTLLACNKRGVNQTQFLPVPAEATTFSGQLDLSDGFAVDTSPYFHIGGDEAFFAGMETDAATLKYKEKHGLKDMDELFRHFLIRMNEAVKATGKQTIVWSGFGE